MREPPGRGNAPLAAEIAVQQQDARSVSVQIHDAVEPGGQARLLLRAPADAQQQQAQAACVKRVVQGLAAGKFLFLGERAQEILCKIGVILL